MSIRWKVIIPYVLLTFVVAVIGLYVITHLVAVRQEERLRNQLLEAGRIFSTQFTLQERRQLQTARLIAYTVGVADALQAGDRASLEKLIRPQVATHKLKQVFLIDLQGQEQLHLFQKDKDTLELMGDVGMGKSQWLSSLLITNSELARRVLAINPQDNKYYLYSALTVMLNQNVVGVVVVGTPLDSLLQSLKMVSLADVVFYDTQGRVILSTLQPESEIEGAEAKNYASLQSAFGLDQIALNEILQSPELVLGENVFIDGRGYSIARGVLQIGREPIGVFGVILPLDFVTAFAAESRNFYSWIFILIVAGVFLVGYFVSRPMIVSLQKLLTVSQAVAAGDLSHRAHLRTNDEFGVLAQTFDEMLSNLQTRNAELQKAHKILEQMDRAKATFIEVAAHELRTPLTLVKGYTQMLALKFKDEPETVALTQGILEGAERMQEIVSSMLDVSRIDSNILKIVPEEVNLGVVIGRACKTFQDALKERNLTLTIQGVDGLPLIQADPDQLYKVFYHLLMNAIKYTPDGGRITIHGHLVEGEGGRGQVEIIVSDTGIGIDPEHHQLIFEKFYQTGEVYMHSSGKTKFKGGGPGLGLAIARGIIQAHAGHIWVESPGHDETRCPGSQFFVRLPLRAEFHECDTISAP